MTPDDLAARLGKRSKSIVYRLENEEQEPDVATINAIVAALPLSAEELLRAMGVSLNPPAAPPRRHHDAPQRRRAGHPVPGVRHVVLHGHRTPGER